MDLFGLFPLLCVSGLNEGVHDELARAVDDRDGNDLVSVVKAGELKVEEKNVFALHVEALRAVCVADSSSFCKIKLIAMLAELFLVSYVLSALNAHKGLTDAGLFVVKIYLCAVLFERESNGLFNCLIVKLCKTLFCKKAVGCGAAGAHSVNDSAAGKNLELFLGIAEVPVVDIRFFECVGTEIEDNALVVIFTERARKSI